VTGTEAAGYEAPVASAEAARYEAPVTSADEALYDDQAFFDRYQQLRQRGGGLNEDLERPALVRLLPAVAGAEVLDIGCGDGALGRWLAGQGATHVLCTDPSARMLALAARGPQAADPRISYLRAGAEELALPPESLDLVVSSLALHYVAGYAALIGRVADWLRPGGHLVYSVEHPVCTSRDPMTGWVAAGAGTVWPVDDYARETARTQQWLGAEVTKHHRRLATLIGGVLAAGLVLAGIDEPSPDDQVLARRPDLADHRRRPPLLLLSARKPAALGAAPTGQGHRRDNDADGTTTPTGQGRRRDKDAYETAGECTRAIRPGGGAGTASGCRIAAIASTPSTSRGPGRTTSPLPSTAQTGMPGRAPFSAAPTPAAWAAAPARS
jgi:SAM-dependent methyltransferase